MADVLHWIATSDFDEPTELLDATAPHADAHGGDRRDPVGQRRDHRFASSLMQTIATALDAWQEPQVAGATMGEIPDQRRLAPRRPQHALPRRARPRPTPPQRPVHRARRAHRRRRVRAQRQDRPPDRPAAAARPRRGLQHRAAAEPRRDRLDRPRAGRAPALRAAEHQPSYDRWGSDRAETIIANHRARLFCSGIGDRATLDYLRGTLGDEEIARISTHHQAASLNPAHAPTAPTSARSPPRTASAKPTQHRPPRLRPPRSPPGSTSAPPHPTRQAALVLPHAARAIAQPAGPGRGPPRPARPRNSRDHRRRPIRPQLSWSARSDPRPRPDCRRRRPGSPGRRLPSPSPRARFRRPDGSVPAPRRKSKPHPTGGNPTERSVCYLELLPDSALCPLFAAPGRRSGSR